MVERSSINGIAAVWASDNDHVSGWSETVLAVDLLLTSIVGGRTGPVVDVAVSGGEVVGALLTVILICPPSSDSITIIHITKDSAHIEHTSPGKARRRSRIERTLLVLKP